MRSALHEAARDLIISDYHVPQFSALLAFHMYQVSAMKAGAHDYVMKHNPFRPVPAVAREVREAEIRRERRRAEKGSWRSPNNVSLRQEFVEADPGQLQQLIMNLIIDGGEAIGSNNGDVLVTVARREIDKEYIRAYLAPDAVTPGTDVRLQVDDTGWTKRLCRRYSTTLHNESYGARVGAVPPSRGSSAVVSDCPANHLVQRPSAEDECGRARGNMQSGQYFSDGLTEEILHALTRS